MFVLQIKPSWYEGCKARRALSKASEQQQREIFARVCGVTSAPDHNMSTRWYPLYRHGNPQLRVFLPNFFMKLVKPRDPQPPNVVQFQVSMEMTKYDIKNYLEKIYNVPVENVITHNRMGKFTRSNFGGYLVKADDYKVAYVTLPKDQKFEFPDIFPKAKEEEMDKQKKQIKVLETEYKRTVRRHDHRHGVPSWFGV